MGGAMGGRRRIALGLVCAAAGALAVALGPLACASPPREPENLCAIFQEKHSWYREARRVRERWGVPEPVQLALIFQESSYRARARPPRRRLLWILPGPRPSSAYGYGQVVESTWQLYRQQSGRVFADRDDFADVVDFIGWYANRIQLRAGVSPVDAYGFYLAYHEGPGGFRRGTHNGKPWLLRAARRVEARAQRYARQYASCAERLERRWWPWSF
jgi:hypothetical protein